MKNFMNLILFLAIEVGPKGLLCTTKFSGTQLEHL